MGRRRLWLAGAVVIVGLGALVWLWPGAPGPSSVSSVPAAGGSPASLPRDGPPGAVTPPGGVASAPSGVATGSVDLPSLRDTQVDGGLRVDGRGDFVPDREALAFFDYFLSARGEASEEALRERVREEILRRLDPPADAQAIAFFEQYVAYQEAGHALTADARIADAGDLERRFQWVRELRREHFGEALSQALFGDEEAMVLASLEERRILDDPDLSPEERADRLAEVEEQLPDAIRESRRRARLPAQAWQQEQTMREDGANDAEIQAYREATFGPEAAARLAELDRRRAERAAAKER